MTAEKSLKNHLKKSLKPEKTLKTSCTAVIHNRAAVTVVRGPAVVINRVLCLASPNSMIVLEVAPASVPVDICESFQTDPVSETSVFFQSLKFQKISGHLGKSCIGACRKNRYQSNEFHLENLCYLFGYAQSVD